MNNSLKAGIISGLIAGIIAGIIGAIFTIFVMKAGLPYIYYPTEEMPLLPITKIFSIEIILSIIFGIILSIIFYKAYDVIPGKRISKYIIFGLFCHLVLGIRLATFGMPYFIFMPYISWIIIGFPKWMIFALAIGFPYEYLIKKKFITKTKKKITTYNMSGGALIGAIVGIIGGLVANLTINTGIVIELWGNIAGKSVSEYYADIELVSYQLGTQFFIHLLWGTIFGIIFARVYNVVPGKGAIKGLYYGLIVALLTGVHKGAFYVAYGIIQPLDVYLLGYEMKAVLYALAQQWILVDLFVYIVYGLLIGRLYKPSK